MLERLRRLFGMAAESGWPYPEYDPVYGLPRRAVEAWLARNPQLRKEYEVEEWLNRNPPLREEAEAARKQKILALRSGGVAGVLRILRQHAGPVDLVNANVLVLDQPSAPPSGPG